MKKTAFVTGAGRRVGQAIAVELAKHGFEVVIHYRSSREGAEETLRLCEAAGGSGWLVQGDLSSLDETMRMGREVAERCPSLDLLVHNASTFTPRTFEEITPADWDLMQNVHVRSPFFLTQLLLPCLRAADDGLVVCMGDIGADRPVPGYAHYSVSKASLMMLMKCIAVELAPTVRAVAVSPGQVIWPEEYPEALREELRQRIPLKRVGTPEDVARLVRFLSLEGAYLNGINVDVDGGLAVQY